VDKENKNDASYEGELRRYLLGEQTEQEEEQFEQRLITGSDELFQEVDEFAEVVQDELVEEYVSGKLTGPQRTAFERRLLSLPNIREKLLVQKALRAAAGRKRSTAERLAAWLRPVLMPVPAWAISATLLLVAGGSWSVYRISVLQARLDEPAKQVVLTVAPESLRSQVHEEQSGAPAREQTATAVPPVRTEHRMGMMLLSPVAPASVILQPGLVRSGGPIPQVAIASGQQLVELRLDVGIDEYPRYRAAIHDSADSEIISLSRLRAVPAGSTVFVVVPLPAQVLQVDDYQARLNGVTASGENVRVDSFPFRVVRAPGAPASAVGRDDQR
jgi:hypothetical protein